MKRKIVMVLFATVLCMGCSSKKGASTEISSVKEDSITVNWIAAESEIEPESSIYTSYMRNEDGTWESGGQVYQYCIEMVKEDSVDGKDYFTKRIVLSNLEELDPQKVDSLEPYSDKYPAEYDSSEALLVEEISWSGKK